MPNLIKKSWRVSNTLAMWQKKQYMHDQCDVVIILDLYAELYQAADEMIYTFDKQKWLHEKSEAYSDNQCKEFHDIIVQI